MRNNQKAAAMMTAILDSLDLSDHSIVFHVLDACGDSAMAAGSVFEALDLEASDAFLALAGEYDSAPALPVSNVTTYMIGNGESDTATEAEVDALARFRSDDPGTFDDMLYYYADVLASLDDMTIQNPYYFDE